ncbi:MAG: hypothetical protein KatS3mg022_3416 [Armatimonadota bacterium]|nr:MAG: hypothetical protein KatS3mg022_1454 [Armatimonadota bacterium]GIV17981.1 MAG: hypothetical protein KatS3mg022_3416 [Armatimonadota bacterium]
MDDVKLLLKMTEAAEMLSVSRANFYRLVSDGRIRTVRLGRARRVPVDELRRFVDDLCRAQSEGEA